ncbi:MAG: hypothetical protein K2M97_07505 [Muribaculaceae bacterium]|nr:hypothetical protein [Muribaculaceae bacterium]
MNRTALFLARRLQWRSEGRNKKSPSVTIAISGVALAVAVMMVSVAVVLGFKHEVKSRLLNINDALTIRAYNPDGESRTLNTTELSALITLPENATLEPRTESAAILKTEDDFVAVKLEGNTDAINPDSIGSIAISTITAQRLALNIGDKIPAYFFINERIRVRPLRIDSIYTTGIDEHDATIAYCSPRMLGALLGMNNDEASYAGIRGLTQDQIEPLANNIHSQLLSAYYTGATSTAYGITTILQTDAVYFTWLDLLDTNVVVILTLMAAVASFTLISSLFIIILERVKTIGLLKSLGATNITIRRTFMLMAERLVLKGLLIGNIIAIALILIQGATHIVPLDQANYYVDYVPVELPITAALALNAGTLLLSWIVLILPALIIARISPAATMRYE